MVWILLTLTALVSTSRASNILKLMLRLQLTTQTVHLGEF